MSGVPDLCHLPSSLDADPAADLNFSTERRSRSVDLKCVRKKTPEFLNAGGPGSLRKRPHWTAQKTGIKHNLVAKSKFSRIPGLCSQFTLDEREHRGSLRVPQRGFGLVTDKGCQTDPTVFEKLRSGHPIPPGMRVSPRPEEQEGQGMTDQTADVIRERLQKRLKNPTARCFQIWDAQRTRHLRSWIDHHGQPKELKGLCALQMAFTRRLAASSTPGEAIAEIGELLTGIIEPEHAAVFMGDSEMGFTVGWASAGVREVVGPISREELQGTNSLLCHVADTGNPINAPEVQKDPRYHPEYDGLGNYPHTGVTRTQ